MKSLTILFIIFLSTVFTTNFQEHQFAQSEVIDDSSLEVVDAILDSRNLRKLTESTPRKMIITYDISSFNNLNPSNLLLKEDLERIIQILVKFYSDFLTVLPKPEGTMKWGDFKKNCGTYVLSQEEKEIDRDSDLHIYITYFEEADSTKFSRSRGCRFMKELGVTHGEISFNLSRLRNLSLKNNPISFDFLNFLIRDVIHIFGFSKAHSNYWVDSNQQPYSNPTSEQVIRGLNTTLLQTPHVLAFAREYFGCPNLPGMPLENQGVEGIKDYNWEATILPNEILTALYSPSTNFLSKFTTSMLRDTGFFASVNPDFEEEIYFGKGAGCSFVLGDCDSTRREFCVSGKKQCDFYGFGVSYCTETSLSDPGCKTFYTYSDKKCVYRSYDVKKKSNPNEQIGVSYGANSRCFMSNLSHPTLKQELRGLCYNYTCNEANQITIQIGNTTATCTQNSQKVSVDGLLGQIICPDQLDAFCHSKKFCPNYCSSNGYCLKGVCKCLEGFSGIDCSKKQNENKGK